MTPSSSSSSTSCLHHHSRKRSLPFNFPEEEAISLFPSAFWACRQRLNYHFSQFGVIFF